MKMVGRIAVFVAVMLVLGECARIGGAGRDTDLNSNLRVSGDLNLMIIHN